MEYSKLTDEELVKNIQQSINAQDSLRELVNRHSGIYLDMINGYVSTFNNKSTKDEMIKEKEYQIYSSALKFNPDKGAKFSTYLGNETKWKCLNMYNKNKRHPSVPIQEELIDFFNYKFIEEHQAGSPAEFKNEIFVNIMKQANSHPDSRVGKIFNLRYVEGKDNGVMPWKNVSSKLKLSIQGCINIHNSAIKQFKQSFNKE
tara:strand:- start:23748 stop:24353 length:606 start_codon:yes stop_codon:yes gene_type:complete